MIEELKKLAIHCEDFFEEGEWTGIPEQDEFGKAFNPATALKLIAVVEAAKSIQHYDCAMSSPLECDLCIALQALESEPK